MASRSTNTMAEFLQRMLGDIAEAKILADADLQFLIGLETTILQKLREPVDAIMGMSGMNGGASPMAPVPEQASGMLGQMSGGDRVRGTRMNPAPISPDEMQRMMTVGQ